MEKFFQHIRECMTCHEKIKSMSPMNLQEFTSEIKKMGWDDYHGWHCPDHRVHRKSTRGRYKLSEANASTIKERLLAGESGVALAREFHVSEAYISRLKHGTRN